MSTFLYRLWTVLFVAALMLSCTQTLPNDYAELNEEVTISPDYRNLIIPCNIAPLNFKVEVSAEKILVGIQGEQGGSFVLKGPKVLIPEKKWRSLLEANKSGKYSVEVYVQQNGEWNRYKPFTNSIAADSIDEYLSYRLIEPSYVLYENLCIRQRHLGSFWEKDIYNNNLVSEKEDFQCINCHSYQNYQTDNMQFHARAHHAGTLIVCDGVPRKVNLKTEQLISGGVYPAWHPFEKLIAYSVNNTNQLFHSKDIQKVEVLDRNSDLILYDIEKNQVSIIQNDSIALETFPAWSPDGKTLYYSSARKQKILSKLESKTQKKAAVETEINFIPGDIVHLKGQNVPGKVLEVKGGKITVAFGSIKSTVTPDKLEKSKAAKIKDLPDKSLGLKISEDVHRIGLNFKQEIDLRGLRGDEALQQVMYYIDEAVVVGVSNVRLLHGTGTGALRTLIRNYLGTVPEVKSFRDEHVQLGGAGITVVEFKH
jgi:hypothetical protein